eukprot:gene11606-34311_t
MHLFQLPLDVLLPILLVGALWGITNPLVKRGSAVAEQRVSSAEKQGAIHSRLIFASTPAFFIPFGLNQCGSALFAYLLGNTDISLLVPAANAAAVLFTAVTDVALHEKYDLRYLIPGALLIAGGIILCGKPTALLGCWDYVAFPLLMIVESVAVAKGALPKREPGAHELSVPAARSDRVVEAVLDCLLALVERSKRPDVDQRMDYLQRLTPLTKMPRQEASEEARATAFKCLAAILSKVAGPDEAPLLGDVSTAPLLGFLVCGCLEASENETVAGSEGSRVVSSSALSCLRSLLQHVRDADALAFFLPGVASGLAKQIVCASAAPRSHIGSNSAAVGVGSSTIIAAVHGFVDITCMVLGDQSSFIEPASASCAAIPSASTSAVPAPSPGRLRVDRSPAWVAASVTKLHTLASKALPPLCTHPRTSVREALAIGVLQLLKGCSKVLGPEFCRTLLELVFTLAQDEWPQVSGPCIDWITKDQPSSAGSPHASLPKPDVSGPCIDWITKDQQRSAGSPHASLPKPDVSGPCIGWITKNQQSSAGSPHASLPKPDVSGPCIDWITKDQPSSAGSPHASLPKPDVSGPCIDWITKDQHSSAGSPHASLPKPDVSGPCIDWITKDQQRSEGSPQASVSRPDVWPLFQHLLDGLQRSVKMGDTEGTMHARRLSTALLYLGPQGVATQIIERPAVLSQLLSSLAACFAFDPASAQLLLHSSLQDATKPTMPQAYHAPSLPCPKPTRCYQAYHAPSLQDATKPTMPQAYHAPSLPCPSLQDATKPTMPQAYKMLPSLPCPKPTMPQAYKMLTKPTMPQAYKMLPSLPCPKPTRCYQAYHAQAYKMLPSLPCPKPTRCYQAYHAPSLQDATKPTMPKPTMPQAYKMLPSLPCPKPTMPQAYKMLPSLPCPKPTRCYQAYHAPSLQDATKPTMPQAYHAPSLPCPKPTRCYQAYHAPSLQDATSTFLNPPKC